jgi:uncharacterized protein (TIGR02246 family)
MTESTTDRLGSFFELQLAIMRLHAEYTDAVWRQDVAAFGDCFARDAEWRVSGTVVRGRSNIETFMAGAFTKYRRILMTFRTPIVHLGAEGLSARTYVSEQSVLANGTAYAPIGTYYERFVHEDGRWLFGWRLFMTEYVGPPDLSGQFFDNPEFGRPPAMPPLDQPSINRSGIIAAKNSD